MQIPTNDNSWLKASNWQEVLEDPNRLPEDIRHYLETQNRRTEEWLGGTESRKWIIDELKATIRDRRLRADQRWSFFLLATIC